MELTFIEEIKNWKQTEKNQLFTEWKNRYECDTVRARHNTGTFHETIGLWSVWVWNEYGQTSIAVEIETRDKAEKMAMEWMKVHPIGMLREEMPATIPNHDYSKTISSTDV